MTIQKLKKKNKKNRQLKRDIVIRANQLFIRKQSIRKILKFSQHKKCKYLESPEHEKIKKPCIKNVKKVNFLQEVKEGLYCICTICHRNLIFYEEYQVLISELYQPVKSFDEKHMYICETYHKYLYNYSMSVILQ